MLTRDAVVLPLLKLIHNRDCMASPLPISPLGEILTTGRRLKSRRSNTRSQWQHHEQNQDPARVLWRPQQRAYPASSPHSPRRSAVLTSRRYMEKYSSLSSKGLAVSVEQVSIFLTTDGTVISFFESSADDIEYVPKS